MEKHKSFKMHQFGFLFVGWISLSAPHDVRDTFPLVHQANQDAPVDSISPNIIDLSIHTVKSSQVASVPGKQSSNKDWQPSKKKRTSLKKTDTFEKEKCKVHNVQAEKVAVAKENCEKWQPLTDLRQTYKPLNHALKKTVWTEKSEENWVKTS